MRTVENHFSPIESYLSVGDSIVIQGNSWDDAVIRSFEYYGTNFTVNTGDIPYFEDAHSNVLVLGALGCSNYDIYALTGLGTESVHKTIRQRLRIPNYGPEATLHQSFMKGLLSTDGPVSQPPVPIMPTEMAGIIGAAGGLSDRTIATRISQHQTIKGFLPELFPDIMAGFYERIGVSGRIGSVLFGHAMGILDARAPLASGTPGSTLLARPLTHQI